MTSFRFDEVAARRRCAAVSLVDANHPAASPTCRDERRDEAVGNRGWVAHCALEARELSKPGKMKRNV